MGAGASIGDVKARLTLDTAGFDGPMKLSEATATASGRSIEQAAKKAGEAQAFAAKFAGDAINQQTLRILAARNSESVASADLRKALALNRAGYLGEEGGANLAAAALQRLTAAKEATAAASMVQARVAEVANHATVSQMMATSAAVRSMEGNPGIRATERFLTTIPGVGRALQMAFPVIGGIAFGAMIVEMGMKVAEFIKKVNEMPEAIRRGFESLHLSALQSNDALRLTNDELQNSINKLNGTPENNLAIALDEARLKADDLARSLEEDVKKVKELLAANNISELAALMGKASTSSVAGSVNSFQQKFSDIGYQRNQAVHSGDSATVAAKDRELAQVRQQAIDWAADQLKVRNNSATVEQNAKSAPGGGIIYQGKTYQDMAGDQTGNKNILQGFQTTIQDSVDREGLKSANGTLVAAEKAAQEKKRLATEGQTAENKAARDRLSAMENQLNNEKQQQSVSLKSEYDYWASRIAAFKVGSTEYASLVKRTQDLATEGARKASETIKKFQESQLKGSDGSAGIEASIARLGDTRQRDAVKTARDSNQDGLDSNQLSIASARNDARVREAQVTDQAGRSISRYAAAIQMAQVHAEEFKAVMEGLQSDLSIKQYQNTITPSRENAKAVTDAQAAIAVTVSQRTVQSQGDQDAIYGRQTSAIVGVTDAFDALIIASKDTAAQFKKFTEQALSGFNQQAVRALTGQRTNFRGMGAGLARDATSTALSRSEGRSRIANLKIDVIVNLPRPVTA